MYFGRSGFELPKASGEALERKAQLASWARRFRGLPGLRVEGLGYRAWGIGFRV